jgi:hypothetical protein
MGVLADRLDSMRVHASVSGGSVSAELHGRFDVRLEFAPGYYRRADERTLQMRLSSLGRLLWAARMKEHHAIVRAEGGDPIPRERATRPLDLAYYRCLDALVAEGSCADGRIRISVRGMREWTVNIKAGTLWALREGEFVVRVNEAAAALILDQFDKVLRLEQQFYQPLNNDEVR